MSSGGWGDTSGIGETRVPLGVVISKKAFCLSALDGRSLSRSDICRLKGDWLPSWSNPRKLPCLSSRCGAAWGRSMANGLTALGWGATIAVFGCCSPSRSVNDCWRKLPVRVNVELLRSNVIVTPHSLSRRCLRSRHTAKAQPTACDNLSPESFDAKNPWHIQRRVVPSRQM